MTGSLNSSLNETVEPRGGMREKQKERWWHWQKRQRYRHKNRDKVIPRAHATCTSKMDFAVLPCLVPCCGNVNQNGNENLCNSNWICTDEGHFTGQEEQTNSQNEDWSWLFCNSLLLLHFTLNIPPCTVAALLNDSYCIPWNTHVMFGIQTENAV